MSERMSDEDFERFSYSVRYHGTYGQMLDVLAEAGRARESETAKDAEIAALREYRLAYEEVTKDGRLARAHAVAEGHGRLGDNVWGIVLDVAESAKKAEAVRDRLREALEEAVHRMTWDSDFIGRKSTRELDIARTTLGEGGEKT